jgi:hypothetical protein
VYHLAVQGKSKDDSEEHTGPFFSVEYKAKQLNKMKENSRSFSKLLNIFTKLHGITFHNTEVVVSFSLLVGK